jgi:hypothetical protein
MLIGSRQLTDFYRSATLKVRVARQHSFRMIEIIDTYSDVPSEVGG